MGALVVLAPIVADYLYLGRMVESATARPALNHQRVDWQLSSTYSFGCYTLGTLMIVLGMAGSGLFRTFVPPNGTPLSI
jgi:hypothetical protein